LEELLQQEQAWQQQAVELAQPNHTLGLHYLIALERLNSSIKAYTIPRRQAQYHDATPSDQHIASATAIRKLLQEGKQLAAIKPYVPNSTYELLEQLLSNQQQGMSWESFAQALYYQLTVHQPHTLAQFREIEEGLEHRIIHS